MFKFEILAVIAKFYILDVTNGENQTRCGSWKSFKDEKCFQTMKDKVGSHDDANKICSDGGSLVSIHSAEEQQFLADLWFKTEKIVNSVWIGAKYNTELKKYVWSDGTEMLYTNWAPNYPKNNTEYCVEMSKYVDSLGKWINVPCEKVNSIVCQKMSTWSLDEIKKVLFETKKKLEDNVKNCEDTKKKLEENVKKTDETKKELDDNVKKTGEAQKQLQENVKKADETQKQQVNIIKKLELLEKSSIPVGFIYVQLPSQSEPKAIWPSMVWTDVTPSYAGLFFRAEGGNSLKFGQVQNENSPRFVGARHVYDVRGADSLNLQPGVWSNPIYLSQTGNGDQRSMSFLVSNAEVVPRNMAMKFWKRTQWKFKFNSF